MVKVARVYKNGRLYFTSSDTQIAEGRYTIIDIKKNVEKDIKYYDEPDMGFGFCTLKGEVLDYYHHMCRPGIIRTSKEKTLIGDRICGRCSFFQPR